MNLLACRPYFRGQQKIGGWLRNRTPDRQVTTVFGTACRPFSGTIQCWTSRQESNLRITRVIKQRFGNTVDFVGDNRVIFDLGGNKYRLVVHVSFTFGRALVKFIGTHAAYDRTDPETVSWRKK